MSWSTPTLADLHGSLSADEVETLGAKGLGENQDAATQAISRAVDLVRGYVRRAGVTLDAAGTIPPELLGPAMDIAAVDFFLRLNLDVKDGRRDRRRDAMQILRDLADGKGIAVVAPDADTLAPGMPFPSILSIDRTTGRAYEDGI